MASTSNTSPHDLQREGFGEEIFLPIDLYLLEALIGRPSFLKKGLFSASIS